MTGDVDLTVEGTVEGDVLVSGAIVIAEGGAVTGDAVEASSVDVGGALTADVSCDGAVTVRAGASLRGKVRAKSLRIDEGASVSADLDCEFELPAELR
ncbi:MAG: polymer-forming cytoskeletal protein [Polyangiaceae bacterium]|nr:polymer-forming cytoskeletal protein [Polyangiaceae bacterium]